VPNIVDARAHPSEDSVPAFLANIAICVATFRRPEGIRRLLGALEKLEFRKCATPLVRVIVVNNDPDSAGGLAELESFSRFRWPLLALAEKRSGISYARNCAICVALAEAADAVVFIDDDEVPTADWLDELLYAQRIYGTEAIVGPVVPQYEQSVPTWVIRGGFFVRPRFATGTSVKFAGSGNLLVTSRVLRETGLMFGELFGRSGGSDTLLTLQLRQRGARIIWADKAVVHEIVPRERTNGRWLLRRAFLGGYNWARIEYLLKPSPWRRLSRCVKGMGNILRGVVTLVPSLLMGRSAIVKSVGISCRGVGTLAALCGCSLEMYGKPRGNAPRQKCKEGSS
jgi:succinoglycan biosynthesis protein ExoM